MQQISGELLKKCELSPPIAVPSVHSRISPWMRAGGSGEAAATARLGWNKVIRRAVFMSPCVVLGWTGEGKQPRVDVFMTFFLLYVYLRLLKIHKFGR